MPTRSLEFEIQSWPIEGVFNISRGAKREAVVVVVRISEGDGSTPSNATTGLVSGRGECVPYARYGETPESVIRQIEDFAPRICDGMPRAELSAAMPPGAARNALDCALIDLEVQLTGRPAHDLLGLPRPVDRITSAYTISLGPAEEMAARAAWAKAFPLLKLKLGGEGDIERMRAVRAAVPDARLTVDANEAWTSEWIEPCLAVAAEVGVELVEQPLPADNDGWLSEIDHPVAICADESFHTAADIPSLTERYDAVNIKLDKTGGLTAAVDIVGAAKAAGLKVMVGCMVGTSLSMAPALLLAGTADWVDLDGPLLLARDRHPALTYNEAQISPAPPGLWGVPVEWSGQGVKMRL